MNDSLKFFLGFFLVFSGPAWAEADLAAHMNMPVQKHVLKNGLTVLIHVDDSVPFVSVNQWYRVGSKDEQVGRTGLAHFFEHLMFKGTKKFPKDTWGSFLKSKGADLNAFTSYDYTGYYINAPSEQLELILQIESDRMRGLLFDQKEINSEREVVKEERRMRFEDSVEGTMREEMAKQLYVQLPYRWLPIGSMKDLNEASIEDMKKFYKSFYSPNNSVLVVAGAVKADRLVALVEKYYGGIKSEAIERPALNKEPVQPALRSLQMNKTVEAPTIFVSYLLPDNNHPDHAALDVLAFILGQGKSSRLYQDLVYNNELALNVGAHSQALALAGQFDVSVAAKPGVDPEKVLSRVEDQILTLRHRLVDNLEVEKAKNNILKGFVDSLKRVAGRARLLANYEVIYGDHRRMYADLKAIQAVTPDDVRRVAKLYLSPEKRNIVRTVPK